MRLIKGESGLDPFKQSNSLLVMETGQVDFSDFAIKTL